ncbi:MAG: hypothetical protein A3F84_29620 [Candidatus Handelsmanbacteria bacterium RIFCSPLOWO2_12_FULL_64_10]|uniref:Uncharacterized protein n=1 Tax=Handelsmanbacteria sp. (strain RIFCSPLOWO2_12_FULL_64_10) TaxID=1817868 RepID=A0A1F6C306_HANXR|nr:MAG: hypothetical protein A3F84_29620 [Candidatus Handelsmanbacteria bacterium RIFCSPLOWO2_12_FULL_64_10]
MIFSQPLPRIASLVSQHDFVLDAPASEPSAGLPLSNGDLSASLYGGPGLLALSVRKGDAHVGEIGLRIPRLDSGPHPPPNPLPLPYTGEGGGTKGLSQVMGVGEGLTPFPVLLHLYDATAHVALPDGTEIDAFVAATRGLIVLRVRSQRTVPFPAALELCPKYEVRSANDEESIRHSTFDIRHSTFECDGPFRYLRQDLSASLSAVLCGFVYGARSHTAVREDAILATFDVPPSGECLILAGVATSQDGPDPTRSARAEVERALPHGYLLLQREHAVWWERFWEKYEAEDSETTDYRDIYCSRVTCQEKRPNPLPPFPKGEGGTTCFPARKDLPCRSNR